MKKITLALLLLAGCATGINRAYYTPALDNEGQPVIVYDKDNNALGIAAKKDFIQLWVATAGAKFDSSLMDLKAETINSDGSNWNIAAGQDAQNVVADNPIKDITELIRELKGALPEE